MLKEVTATGATTEEAIANARLLLGAPEDADVRTEILEMPKKKVLGLFGGSLAKAKASYEVPDAPASKPEKKKEAKKPSQPKKQAETKKPADEKVKPEPKAEAKPVEKKPEEAPVQREVVDPASSPVLTVAVNYLQTIVTGMGVEKCVITPYKVSDEEVILELDCGEDYGIIIGKWGDTLDSIQYLTRLATNRVKAEGEVYPRISVNIGNYRQKRNKYLTEFAEKKAAAVRKYGRNITLEPMNPYERRIIHTAVQEVEGVTSFSIGSDADRRVVLTLEDGVKPLKPQRNNNRGRGGNNRGRGARQSKPSQVVESPNREKKTDAGAQGFSLYGKLN